MCEKLKIRKWRKFKKVYWLLIVLVLAVVVSICLLLYRPAGFAAVDIASSDSRQGQVNQYLTHELLPQLYNGAQRGEAFELVVIQERINEAIAQLLWNRQFDGINFLSPKVFFSDDCIMLMAAVVKAAEFVVTVEVKPHFDEQGLLNLRLAKVSVGAVNITIPARMIARRVYRHRLKTIDIDAESLQAKIAASLLNDEPFEPVFKIEGKKVQVRKIALAPQKLTIHLAPAGD